MPAFLWFAVNSGRESSSASTAPSNCWRVIAWNRFPCFFAICSRRTARSSRHFVMSISACGSVFAPAGAKKATTNNSHIHDLRIYVISPGSTSTPLSAEYGLRGDCHCRLVVPQSWDLTLDFHPRDSASLRIANTHDLARSSRIRPGQSPKPPSPREASTVVTRAHLRPSTYRGIIYLLPCR